MDVEKRQLTGVKVSLSYLSRNGLGANEIGQWFLFIISTLTSIFLYSLDNTIVADIVPVRRHLKNLPKPTSERQKLTPTGNCKLPGR